MTASAWFSKVEQAQLRRLVNQAFDLRGTPYAVDAIAAIGEWRESTLPDRIERHVREAAS